MLCMRKLGFHINSHVKLDSSRARLLLANDELSFIVSPIGQFLGSSYCFELKYVEIRDEL